MGDPCPTPGQTPTAGPAPTPGRTGLFRAMVRQDCPESPGAWAQVAGTLVLLAVVLAISGAVVYRICRTGDLGSGACWALGLVVMSLWALARIQHGAAVPPLPAQSAPAPVAGHDGGAV